MRYFCFPVEIFPALHHEVVSQLGHNLFLSYVTLETNTITFFPSALYEHIRHEKKHTYILVTSSFSHDRNIGG